MCEAFEKAVIAHCAPTLAGHKCGSLFSWHSRRAGLHQECVRQMDEALSSKGVRVRLLRPCENGCLVYVYRPAMLQQRLRDPAVRSFLLKLGYEPDSMSACLQLLDQKIVYSDGFPHEIGVFLDYPLTDVIDFIRHRGNHYCCLGCWKAYSNEQEARRRFALYRKCRDVYLDCYRRGFGVARLTVAA